MTKRTIAKENSPRKRRRVSELDLACAHLELRADRGERTTEIDTREWASVLRTAVDELQRYEDAKLRNEESQAA